MEFPVDIRIVTATYRRFRKPFASKRMNNPSLVSHDIILDFQKYIFAFILLLLGNVIYELNLTPGKQEVSGYM